MRTLAAIALVTLTCPALADDEAQARARMVETQIAARGVLDRRVLAVMREVPRHLFVPAALRPRAYDDTPLPIGLDQTISQPFIVASMTELLQPKPGQRILEIGAGSGYQAAVLAKLVKHVYTIEIVEPLAARAKQTLAFLKIENVTVIAGDGYRGLPKEAPFDGIIVTAAPERVPQPLLDQLAVGGRMVIPVGSADQELLLIERKKDGYHRSSIYPVRFVPMTGEARKAN